MKTTVTLFIGWMVILAVILTTACTSREDIQPVLLVEPTPTADISALLQNTTQLREENLYLVELKFVREDFLNPLKNLLENEWKATYQTIMVGKTTYESYTVGQELSSKIDWIGTFFDDEFFASYKVIVNSKSVDTKYYRLDGLGNETEVDGETYSQLLAALSNHENLLTIPFSGQTINYVLDRPLREYQFTKLEPLTRYFVTLEISNESWTLDLVKQARNWSNKHEIELEVPKELYDQEGDVWDPQFNKVSFFLRGRLSQMKGKIITRHTEVDPNFLTATTAEGKMMIIPTPK